MPPEGFSWRTVSLGASRWFTKFSAAPSGPAVPLGDGSVPGFKSWFSARREGSPFHGLTTVFLKELADNLSSARMLVLEILMVMFGAVVVYLAAEQLRQGTAEDPFLILRLFAPPGDWLLTFVTVLSILVPLMAIARLRCHQRWHNRRTLSRIWRSRSIAMRCCWEISRGPQRCRSIW
jgi:hypothetical protein